MPIRLNSLIRSFTPLNFALDAHPSFIFSLQTLYNVISITSEDRTDDVGVLAYLPHFPQFVFIAEIYPQYQRIKTRLSQADDSPRSLRAIEMFFVNDRGPVETKRSIYLCLVNSCVRSDEDKSLLLRYGVIHMEIRVTFSIFTDYLDVMDILESEGKQCTDGTL